MSWVGDGYCDDETNTESCYYDGGDCCGSNVNTQYCTGCVCLEGGGSGGITTTSGTTGQTTTAGCANWGWVGDGYCDDATNTESCNYDGGDCCGSIYNVITLYCIECLCLE